MRKFHRNFNIMSMFTALLLVLVILFWKIFMNIAVSNVVLNGIIIGTTIFGIGLCFVKMFKLLPEYNWLHAYFNGKKLYGFVPKLLRPVAMVVHNRHINMTTTELNELLELVSVRIDDERESVRYITNTLVFLGLLGTFWGLLLTLGGFAQMIMNINFDSETVLQTMQNNMSVPLAGMATAFTSSLLGLAGSLIVGFLGLQLQFAQNTVVQDLTDFMTQYVLQEPTVAAKSIELATKAPVTEAVYSTITNIYDIFTKSGYEICGLIRIDGKHPAVVAAGTDEQVFIATTNVDDETLQRTLKRIELCFADTLEQIPIYMRILTIDGTDSTTNGKIIHFVSTDTLAEYMSARKNIRPKTDFDKETFDAYTEYISTVIEYLFKSHQ